MISNLDEEIINLKRIDIEILKIFNNLKEQEYTGTLLIAKSLYDGQMKNQIRKKEMYVIYRIKKLYPLIIRSQIPYCEDKKNKYQYTLISENIKFCKHKFSEGIKNALIMKKNGREIIISL